MLVYALDIGGSSIKHGWVDTAAGAFKGVLNSGTVQLRSNKFSDLEQDVLEIISRAVRDNSKLTAIGISTAGSVDTNGVVISAGHFDGYANISWGEIIRGKHSEITKVKTTNDGRASAWGEYISSPNKYKSHIHVVVGTGVGGGLIYNNELLMGDSGQAGYIGHMKISSEKTITCSCGKMGCLETLASAPGIVQHLENITGDDNIRSFDSVLSLAKAGNANAIQAIRIGGHWLGVGIGNAMNILNPTAVTVGGGVMSGTNELAKDIYFDSVVDGAKFAAHKRVFASCNICKAMHGNDSGMIGAAYLCV